MPTRKLSALMIDTAGLSALSRATQHIAALQRLYAACTPPDLIQVSRVVNSRNGILVIAADNGAVAAKLRQLAPRLLKNLQKQRAQITGIQVQVQVGQGAQKPQTRIKKSILPVDLIDDFERLSAQVKDPDLRSALSRFSAHQRGKR